MSELRVDPIRRFHRTDCPYIGQRGDCSCGPVPRTFVRLDGSSFAYTDDSVLPALIESELGTTNRAGRRRFRHVDALGAGTKGRILMGRESAALIEHYLRAISVDEAMFRQVRDKYLTDAMFHAIVKHAVNREIELRRLCNLVCVGNDLSCPCQDGDICHYVDDPITGTKELIVSGHRTPIYVNGEERVVRCQLCWSALPAQGDPIQPHVCIEK